MMPHLSYLCLMPLAIMALSCPSGVVAPQVTEEQAVNIAKRQVLFEPEAIDAEMSPDEAQSIWRVTMRGRLPGQSVFEFESATVVVDAHSGDVLEVESP